MGWPTIRLSKLGDSGVLYGTVTECAHGGHSYLSHITCVCN